MVALLDRLYDSVVPLHRLSEIYAADIPSENIGKWQRRVLSEAKRASSVGVPAVSSDGPAREVVVSRRGSRLTGRWGSRRHRVMHHVRWNTPARRYFAAVEERAALRQLATILSVDNVVYNTAGELLSIGSPVSRMFELAVAAESGIPFAVVNVTYEPSNDMERLTRTVLPRAALIFARDERSRTRLIEHGVAADRVDVVRDCAFLFTPLIRAHGGRGVGVAISGTFDSAHVEPWTRCIRILATEHGGAEFVSNEYEGDIRFASLVAVRSGGALRIGPKFSDFRDYTAYLAGFDVVVTARFHTALLCSLIGVPWIGLEGTSRRIRGGMHGLIPEEQMLSATDAKWPGEVSRLVPIAVSPSPAIIDLVRAEIIGAYEAAFPLTK
jgi:hypothetical protein